MMRVDMVVMNATSIPEWSINNEIFGMKLCRLIGLEKVRGFSEISMAFFLPLLLYCFIVSVPTRKTACW